LALKSRGSPGPCILGDATEPVSLAGHLAIVAGAHALQPLPDRGSARPAAAGVQSLSTVFAVALAGWRKSSWPLDRSPTPEALKVRR
jgi:hypothetical protein